MRKRPSFDTAASAILFLVFGGLSAYAYAAILKTEAPSHVFMHSIAEGAKHFHVQHGTSCVGKISTTLSKGENTFVHSVAEVNAEYGRTKTTATINALYQFNPLGQLSESSSDIVARDTRINIKTKDINPMRIQISADLNNKHYDFTLSAPGPVILKKSGAGLYQIEYSQFRAGDGSLLKGFGTNLLSQTALSIVDAEPADTSCEQERRGYLDVAALILRANVKADAIRAILPSMIK